MRSVVVALTLMFFLAAPAPAAVIRVPAHQPTIQAGIDAATDGDQVLVADGIYTGPGNRDIDFFGKVITVRSENGPADCIIDCESDIYSVPHRGFRFHSGEGPDSVLDGFAIRNGVANHGGGISCESSSPTITGNVIRDCWAFAPGVITHGGAIYCFGGSPLIDGNVIAGNSAGALTPDLNNGRGGGIACINSAASIANNLIIDNVATGTEWGRGAGLYFSGGAPLVTNCTFAMNWAFGAHYSGFGGALYCTNGAAVTVRDSICWHDFAIVAGNEIAVRYDATLTISWSDVEGGQSAIWVDHGGVLDWGAGMLDGDPHFFAGPSGDFYLGQLAAGQTSNSPCVDAGDPASPMITGTTRTDEVQDSSVVDMGYHHPLTGGGSETPDTIILSGPSGLEDSPVITFTFTGTDSSDPPGDLSYSWRLDDTDWHWYQSETRVTIDDYLTEGEHTFQVRARDTDGNLDPFPAERAFQWTPWEVPDGWVRLVTGPGPGWYNPPLVRGTRGEWLAYNAGGYGVNVACGDIDHNGVDEVITGPGPGRIYGPQVRGWAIDGTPLSGVNFMAYGTQRYGVNVGAADLDGDGRDEIITGAGPGAVFGPHVRGWSYSGGSCTPVPGTSFFAYGTSKWGVNVAGGDVNGNGQDEIITGAGPGPVFGAHVRGWSWQDGAVAPLPGCSFFAYFTPRWGVNVGCGDIDGDGIDEIITGPGPGPTFRDHVRAFDYDGSSVAQVPGVSFFAIWGYYGAQVSAADVDDDGIDEILSVPGAGPENTAVVVAWNADDGMVSMVPGFYEPAYHDWMRFGGKVAGIRND